MRNEMYLQGDEIVLEKKTVEVYVSKKGGLFLTEESALNDSYTHKHCDKHDNVYAVNSYCYDCANDKSLERYYNMEEVEWDGVSWMYSEEYEEWCPDLETAEELADYHEVSLKDLRLVMAKPTELSQVEEDYWEDVWCDGAELPEQVQQALDHLNKTIREHGKEFSWETTNKRVKL